MFPGEGQLYSRDRQASSLTSCISVPKWQHWDAHGVDTLIPKPSHRSADENAGQPAPQAPHADANRDPYRSLPHPDGKEAEVLKENLQLDEPESRDVKRDVDVEQLQKCQEMVVSYRSSVI